MKGLIPIKRNVLSIKEISPSCSYCEYGRLSPDKENILCLKSGIRLPDSCCGKFSYDPLKRQPKRRIPLSEHTAEEFYL